MVIHYYNNKEGNIQVLLVTLDRAEFSLLLVMVARQLIRRSLWSKLVNKELLSLILSLPFPSSYLARFIVGEAREGDEPPVVRIKHIFKKNSCPCGRKESMLYSFF